MAEFKVGDCVEWPTMMRGYGATKMNSGVVVKVVKTRPRIKGRTAYDAYRIRREDGRVITVSYNVRTPRGSRERP